MTGELAGNSPNFVLGEELKRFLAHTALGPLAEQEVQLQDGAGPPQDYMETSVRSRLHNIRLDHYEGVEYGDQVLVFSGAEAPYGLKHRQFVKIHPLAPLLDMQPEELTAFYRDVWGARELYGQPLEEVAEFILDNLADREDVVPSEEVTGVADLLRALNDEHENVRRMERLRGAAEALLASDKDHPMIRRCRLPAARGTLNIIDHELNVQIYHMQGEYSMNLQGLSVPPVLRGRMVSLFKYGGVRAGHNNPAGGNKLVVPHYHGQEAPVENEDEPTVSRPSERLDEESTAYLEDLLEKYSAGQPWEVDMEHEATTPPTRQMLDHCRYWFWYAGHRSAAHKAHALMTAGKYAAVRKPPGSLRPDTSVRINMTGPYHYKVRVKGRKVPDSLQDLVLTFDYVLDEYTAKKKRAKKDDPEWDLSHLQVRQLLKLIAK